jgi:hypothetical protein
MFDLPQFVRRGLSRSLGLEFCASTAAALARRVGADAAQVPLRTQDFARHVNRMPSIRLKRFKSYAFSAFPRAAPTPTAFALPQRA